MVTNGGSIAFQAHLIIIMEPNSWLLPSLQLQQAGFFHSISLFTFLITWEPTNQIPLYCSYFKANNYSLLWIIWSNPFSKEALLF